MDIDADTLVEMVNSRLGGFNRSMGLTFTSVGLERCVAQMEIDTRHLQPYGLVHGGVYSAMVETVCSTGAALNVMDQGRSAVGLENATSFLKATRSGRLICTARPLSMGNRSHVWHADVTDDAGNLVASGRVRLMILEAGTRAEGIPIELEHGTNP